MNPKNIIVPKRYKGIYTSTKRDIVVIKALKKLKETVLCPSKVKLK